MNKKGKLVIISAPSGGGKTTVIRELLKKMKGVGRVITSTSREKRKGERNKVDYHFLSRDEFEARIKKNKFYEYAEYAGNYYGVDKDVLKETLQTYRFAFAPLDIQGKKHMDSIGLDHISIFLIPESLDLLQKNISKRGGMDPKELKKRMAVAQKEINESVVYDYQIQNREGHLDAVIDEIKHILEEYA